MPLPSTKHTLQRCMYELICEKKLDIITIQEICERARIGKRTFYRYYTDKYALFEDTYLNFLFKKLDIQNETFLYDIYERLFLQMYEEREFYSHAISSKGQNGFWELFTNLIYPHSVKLLTKDPSIEHAKEFYVKRDIQVKLHLIEEWILSGFQESPADFIQFTRLCDAVHGKWQYQTAMRYEPDKYSLEKFINNEW